VTCMLGYKLCAIALPHRDRRVDEYFNKQRKRWGLEVIATGMAVKRCYKQLRDGGMIAFLGDREFGDAGRVTELCGQKAFLPRGPAYFSIKAGAYIVPSFFLRENKKFYRLVFEQPISPCREDGSPKSEESLMDEYAQVLERYILRYPSQWYNFEKCWINEQTSDPRPQTSD